MERPSPTRGKVSALPRSRLPPANVQVNGHSPAPPAFGHPGATPSGRKQQGLLQTLSKVEQESEDRAFEIIKLRVGQSRQNPVQYWAKYSAASLLFPHDVTKNMCLIHPSPTQSTVSA